MGQRMRFQTPEADVDVIALAKAPAVSGEVRAEVQLGPLSGDLAGALIDRQLHFTCGNDRPAIRSAVQHPTYRTEMATGPDEHPRPDVVVDDPLGAGAANDRNGCAEQQARPRAAEQVVVELTTTNPKADGASVRRVHDVVLTDHTDPKVRDWLKRSSVAVVVGIDLEVVEHLRRDPPGAHLVARKHGLVDNDDVETRLAKPPRARRASRTTTYNHDVAGINGVRSEFQPLARVQGTALLLPLANTTWNNCIQPVVNVACAPAR